MTTVDQSPDTSSDAATPSSDTTDTTGIDQGRAWYLSEALLMVELGGLAAFAFGRAVLDTFGRSPDTFVARGADARTVVLFGLVVAFGPFLALGLLGLAGRPLGPTVRHRLHLALVAVVGGLAAWQIGQGITGYPPESQKLMIAGLVGGLALAYLRASVGTTASFLRFVGVASVVFLVQFLLMSPASGLITGGPTLDDDVARAVAADLGDDPPDVVLIVFDALPTASLLDGTGRVDAEQFPNFARLAGTSTWYRNSTTVAGFTVQAVPAILTGRFPSESSDAAAAMTDENLFTLLGGSYETHVQEQITRLCPVETCPDASGGGLGLLLGDAVDTWVGASGGDDQDEFDLPGALGDDRLATAGEWEADQHPTGSRPQLLFHHVILPHAPWVLTPDGDLYEGVDSVPVGAAFGMTWEDFGIPVGLQRHTLQLQGADRLLGQTLDRLEADRRFDDSLIVVTADHGNAFVPGQPQRALDEGNMEQVLWAPLFVKAPGQTEAAVDDANVMSVDVLPTIAHMLGVDVPWDVDGIPVDDPAARRDDDVKYVQDHEDNVLHAPPGESRIELDDTAPRFEDMLGMDLVEGEGPDGVWKRTRYGDLFGQDVAHLHTGDRHQEDITVERLDDVEGSTTDRPLAEVVGESGLPVGTVVAYALNGTIGAVTAVEPGIHQEGLAHGLLPPRLFRDGDNELTAYVVDGPVGSPALHPVAIEAGG
ncbi:MAG TPA: sulfatase-like hydrolase/transferase [Acidimicrobiales bacterium]|nr:sulfatase-like hydrolase/transferase [Acidimicrobiales bacterium]